jgi:hypothetical protein
MPNYIESYYEEEWKRRSEEDWSRPKKEFLHFSRADITQV